MSDIETTEKPKLVPNLQTSESIAELYSGKNPEAKLDKIEEKTEPEAEKKPLNKVQQRITKLVAERDEKAKVADAEKRRADDLEATIRELRARQASPAEIAAEPRPKRGDFEGEEAYEDALAEWGGKKAIAAREKEIAKQREEAAEQEVATTWQERVQRAISDIPDYADVIRKSEVILPSHMHRAILKSDVGPELAYYFAKAPKEAKRYAEMDPDKALTAIGRLETKLLAEDTDEVVPAKVIVEKSKAPAPINPVRDASAIEAGKPRDFEEYRAKREAEKARKRG